MILIPFLILLSFTQGKSLFIDGPETPDFRWSSSSRSSDGVPDLKVRFSDGSEDSITLTHYTPDEHAEALTFMGTLRGDSSSVVAVTGNSNGSNLHVSIFRNNHTDITVRVSETGKSSHVENLSFGDQNDYVIPTFKIRQTYKPSKRAFPSLTNFRYVAGYTASALSYFNGLQGFLNWFAQFMTHVQAYYTHPSLAFKIQFVKPLPVVDLRQWTSISSAKEGNLNSIRSLTLPVLRANGNGHHLSVFVSDTSGDSTVGIAYLDGICSGTDLMVSITEIRSSILESAKVAAHELGHNFGVRHDISPCNGIMYWNTGGGESWSSCSNEAFSAYYSSILARRGFWCLS